MTTGETTTLNEWQAFSRVRKNFGCSAGVFSSDGRYVVFATVVDFAATATCWDVARRKQLWEQEFDADAYGHPYFASTTELVWRTEKGALRFNLATGESKPFQPGVPLTFSGGIFEGTKVAIKDWDPSGTTLHVRDLFTGETESAISNKTMPPRSFSVLPSPDGRRVLMFGGELRLLDRATGKSLWDIRFEAGHTDSVTDLRISADGRRLVSAGKDGTVRAWDMESMKPLGLWRAISAAPAWGMIQGAWPGYVPTGSASIAISADGRRLALVPVHDEMNRANTIRIVDLNDPKRSNDVEPPTLPNVENSAIGVLNFSPDGAEVLATFGARDDPTVMGVRECIVGAWPAAGGRMRSLGVSEPTTVNRGAFSPRYAKLLTNGLAVPLAPNTTGRELPGAGPGPMSLSPNERFVAGVGRTGPDRDRKNIGINDLRVWDVTTEQLVGTIPWKADRDNYRWAWPRHLALHPSGRFLAISDRIGVRVWDLLTQKFIHTVPVVDPTPVERDFGSSVGSILFHPRGDRLIAGMHDGTILVWPFTAPAGPPVAAAEEEKLVDALLGADGMVGWRAAWRLMEDPAVAVRVLSARVKLVTALPDADVQKLIADLGADAFRTREAAARRLARDVDRVSAALAAAIRDPRTTADVRDRLEAILASNPGNGGQVSASFAAQSRAVAVLEQVNTAESRAVLKAWSGGAAGAWLTREAEGALQRLGSGH